MIFITNEFPVSQIRGCSLFKIWRGTLFLSKKCFEDFQSAYWIKIAKDGKRYGQSVVILQQQIRSKSRYFLYKKQQTKQ